MSRPPESWLLPALVQHHFLSLVHAGVPEGEGALCCGEAGAESLGTRVRFTLRLRAGRVAEARFQAFGCPYTLAVCDWLAGRMTGQPFSDLVPDGPLEWAQQLSVPAERLGRLLVIEDALKKLHPAST